MDEKVTSVSNKITGSLIFREHLADIMGKNTNALVQTALSSPKLKGKGLYKTSPCFTVLNLTNTVSARWSSLTSTVIK